MRSTGNRDCSFQGIRWTNYCRIHLCLSARHSDSAPGRGHYPENIDYIVDHVEVGLPVKGPEDRSIEFVKVIVEESAIS